MAFPCSPAQGRMPTTAATSVLLVHGYEHPQSMRGWAEHFAGASYTCGCRGCPGTAPAGRT